MSRRTLSRVALALFAATSSVGCGGGGGGGDDSPPAAVVDQEFAPTSVNNFSSCDSGYCPAQTFTVGITGTLTGFDLFIRRIAMAGSVTVDLRATNAGVPLTDDANFYEAFTFDASVLPASTQFVHFELTSPIQVIAGEVLAITIRDTVFGSGQLVGWDGNGFPGPYAGGAQFGRAGAYTEPYVVEFTGNGDLGFRTYVIPD